jgi:hypothetical protein
VFTHPQARFIIPAGVPFNWGVTKFWLERLRVTPVIPGLDERISLQILEALLRRHQEYAGKISARSMLQSAAGLISQSENQIKSWIAEE